MYTNISDSKENVTHTSVNTTVSNGDHTNLVPMGAISVSDSTIDLINRLFHNTTHPLLELTAILEQLRNMMQEEEAHKTGEEDMGKCQLGNSEIEISSATLDNIRTLYEKYKKWTYLNASIKLELAINETNRSKSLNHIVGCISLSPHLTVDDFKDIYKKLDPHLDALYTKNSNQVELKLQEIHWGKLGWLKQNGGLELLLKNLDPAESNSLRDTIIDSLSYLLLVKKCKMCLTRVYDQIQSNKKIDVRFLIRDFNDHTMTTIEQCQFVFETNIDQLWGFEVISEPIIDGFRQQFQSKSSTLNRLDKPEWAFSYMLDQLVEHGTWLSKNWPQAMIIPSSTLISDIDIIHYVKHTQLSNISPTSMLGQLLSDILANFFLMRIEDITKSVPTHNSVTPEDKKTVRDIEKKKIKYFFSEIGILTKDNEIKKIAIQQIFTHKSNTTSLFLHTLAQLIKLYPFWEEFDRENAPNLFLMFNKNWEIDLSIEFQSKQKTVRCGLLDIWLELDQRSITTHIERIVSEQGHLERTEEEISLNDDTLKQPSFLILVRDLITSCISRIQFVKDDESLQKLIDGLLLYTIKEFKEILRKEWNSLNNLLDNTKVIGVILDNIYLLLEFLNPSTFIYFTHMEIAIQSTKDMESKMLSRLTSDYTASIQRGINSIYSELSNTPEHPIEFLKGLKKHTHPMIFEKLLDMFEIELQEIFKSQIIKKSVNLTNQKIIDDFIDYGNFLLYQCQSLGTTQRYYLPQLKEIITLLSLPKDQLEQLHSDLSTLTTPHTQSVLPTTNRFNFNTLKTVLPNFIQTKLNDSTIPWKWKKDNIKLLEDLNINQLTFDLIFTIVENRTLIE